MEWYKVKFLKIEKKEIKTIGATGVEHILSWHGTTPVNPYEPIVVLSWTDKKRTFLLDGIT